MAHILYIRGFLFCLDENLWPARPARRVLQGQRQRLGALGLEERAPLVVVLESDALLGHEHILHDPVGVERGDAATIGHTNALRHLL